MELDQGEPGDQAAQGVAVEIDAGTRIRLGHLLDEVGQAGRGAGHVGLGVGGRVAGGRQGNQGGPRPRRAPAGVAEAHHRAGVVAEVGRAQVVDGGGLAGRTEARHRDRHAPLARQRAGRGWIAGARRGEHQPIDEIGGDGQAAAQRARTGEPRTAGEHRGPVDDPVAEPPDRGAQVAERQPSALGQRDDRQGAGLGVGRRSGGHLERQQLDRRRTAEEGGRVEVGVAQPGAEVQLLTGGSHRIAGRHGGADGRAHVLQERVARAHAVGVAHRDVQRARHRAGEDHRARRAGAHDVARGRVVVESAVPGPVGPRGRSEGIGDRGVDRRGVHRGRDGRDRPALTPVGRPARCGDQDRSHRRHGQRHTPDVAAARRSDPGRVRSGRTRAAPPGGDLGPHGRPAPAAATGATARPHTGNGAMGVEHGGLLRGAGGATAEVARRRARATSEAPEEARVAGERPVRGRGSP